MKFLLLLLLVLGTTLQVSAQEETAQAEELAQAQEPAQAEELAQAQESALEEDAEPSADPTAGVLERITDGGCDPCSVISSQHYEAKYCHPTMDPAVDKCCPSSYVCQSEVERGVPLDMCFYGNKTYDIGQDVPVTGPCRRGCQCRASVDKEEPAKVECALVECPSLFSALKPGCRNMFSVDECCEVRQECSEFITEKEALNPNGTLRSGDCFSEGLEYYIGDKIFFSQAPCQYCVCSDEFSGPTGPNCTKMDCPMEYRDREFLRTGCTPLYVDGTCCPSDWICPGSHQIINDPDLMAKGNETASTHCTLGDTAAPRGTALKTYNCHVNCACSTPPDFTCVQYSTCEIALAAQKKGTTP